MNLESEEKRKFAALEWDLTCAYKTIEYAIDPSTALHNHDGHEILLILSGKVNLYTEFGGIVLQRGDLVCIPELAFHRMELQSLNEYDRILINVKESVIANASSDTTYLGTCLKKNPSNILNMAHLSEKEIKIMTYYAKMLQDALKKKRYGDDLVADSFFKLIMVQLNSHFIENEVISHKEIMPKLVMRTFQYIDDHLTEEINLSTLEKELHYNGTYISRYFKKITGITLQQYIIAKKITLSCKLLQEGQAPCDVCFITGFNNYSNYSRTFSKQIGKSPKKYQMDYRNKII